VIVVSDSSPLISLARIGRLDLLRDLYSRILIPFEVYREVTVTGDGLPGSEQVRRANWIEVVERRATHLPLAAQCQSLGAGERGAILLASELNADLTLIDEWKARRIASDAGLSGAGCVGCWKQEFYRGLVPDLRGTYVELLRQGVRLDLRLLRNSLERSGLPTL
jgi:hypothetical protein